MERWEGDHDVERDVFIEIPLRGGDVYKLTYDELKEYKELYPRLNVELQIRRASKWCENNPTRRKTAKGIGRFLGSWMNRAKPEYGGIRRVTKDDYSDERSFLG